MTEPFMEYWKNNYEENLKSGILFKYLDASFLKKNQRLQRRPGVIVLSGPSLENNIEKLKKIRKKVVLIACDTVVYRLNEEEIKPDFVVSIDPQSHFLKEFVKDIDTNPYLLAPTTGSSYLLNNWKGFIFFFNQTDTNKEKQEFFKKLTKPTKRFLTLENGGFVGITALQLSLLLDLYPVTFVGNDLAYTKDGWACKHFLIRRFGKRKITLVLDQFVRGFWTTKSFNFYANILSFNCNILMKNKNLKYFSSSDGIVQLEKIDLDEFGKRFGKKEFNVKEIMKL